MARLKLLYQGNSIPVPQNNFRESLRERRLLVFSMNGTLREEGERRKEHEQQDQPRKTERGE